MLKIRGEELTRSAMAKKIDFSILHPDSTKEQIIEGIDLCLKEEFNSFCVNPNYLEIVAKGLAGSPVEPSVVLDFPFGSGTPAIKKAAAADMLEKGAKALDLVIDVGALKDGNLDLVTAEIKSVVDMAGPSIKTKIIIEAQLLTDEQVRQAGKCIAEAGATYIKSSTGRHGGPSLHTVKLMRESVPSSIGVKVAGTGSFWTGTVVLGCLLAGADLIGTRNGPAILDELPLLEAVFGPLNS